MSALEMMFVAMKWLLMTIGILKTIMSRDSGRKDTMPRPTIEPGSDSGGKPVKDSFLAQLIDVFGYEKGVDLYQRGNVTEKELSDFVALAEKFEVLTRMETTVRGGYRIP